MELSVLIPALNEAGNIERIILAIRDTIFPQVTDAEIIVVDGGSRDGTAEVAARLGARVVPQTERGYGGALLAGFAAAQGEYILTMDADLSHRPVFFAAMREAIRSSEAVIASRYVPGGRATMPAFRRFLSRVLNLVFAFGLSLPIRDLSSGFRLYRARTVRGLRLRSRDFDVLEEIIIKIYSAGYTIREVPFHYEPRVEGRSHARLLKFGVGFTKTLVRMWILRNQIDTADYDERAYRSRLWPQRLWQRRRVRHVTDFVRGASPTLDVGCGSSVILRRLSNPVGVDVRANKLRWMRRYGRPLVNASVYALPFRNSAFQGVVCSQLIEHLPPGDQPLRELDRVLAPGGVLVVATPDYGRLLWRLIGFLYRNTVPAAIGDDHLTHFTRDTLCDRLRGMRYAIEGVRYVFGSELVCRARKAATQTSPEATSARTRA